MQVVTLLSSSSDTVTECQWWGHWGGVPPILDQPIWFQSNSLFLFLPWCHILQVTRRAALLASAKAMWTRGHTPHCSLEAVLGPKCTENQCPSHKFVDDIFWKFGHFSLKKSTWTHWSMVCVRQSLFPLGVNGCWFNTPLPVSSQCPGTQRAESVHNKSKITGI